MQAITVLDFSILHFIADHFHNAWLDQVMILVTKLGDGGFIWIAAALFLILFPQYRKQAPYLLAALAVSFLLGEGIMKHLVERIRPFYIEEVELLIQPPGGYSFPSGHTTTSFASAMALWKINRRFGAIGFGIASSIGFSRLYLFVHYPTDVVCGIVLGIGTAVLVGYIFRIINNHLNHPNTEEKV